MNNSSKPRLSDVAKQSTTDRASRLVSGFMPSPPPATPVAPKEGESMPASPDNNEQPAVEASDPVIPQVVTPQAVPSPASPPVATQKVERAKKGPTPTSFTSLIAQPLPPGLKCDKPIMLAGSQHKILRELSFRLEKPMTEILYNLLEGAMLPYQREQQKDA